MNPDDFRFMRRGKQMAPFLREDAALLAPISIRGVGFNRALLLLHGFSSSPAVFRLMLSKLHGYDAIVCPLLPGHGESIHAFAEATADEWLQASLDAGKQLLAEYKTVDVLGLSLGGVLAYRVSQMLPIRHLFLLAPAFDLKLNIPLAHFAARVLRFLGVHSLTNQGGNLCAQHEAELAYRRMPLATIIELFNLIQNTHLSPLSCDVDLFLGCHDEVVDSARVAARFTDLHVNTHWLAHSAHVLPLDTDVDNIIACINARHN